MISNKSVQLHLRRSNLQSIIQPLMVRNLNGVNFIE